VAYQMCKAVGALHEKNIIHRDIKLENIFITKDNNFKLGKIFVNILLLCIYSFYLFLFILFYFILFFFFWVISGDYGISRKEGVSMTINAGTQYV
jgi:serine/threonine protein kinase